MKTDWTKCTLGDVIQLQRGFDITRKDQQHGVVPVYSSGGLSSFHDTAMAQGPGVVMGRKGTLGRVFYVDRPFWPHDTTLWVRDFKGSEPRFVYYFLQTLDFEYMNVGSANPTLNRNHVHPLPVHWPSSLEQRAISEVLGALDDKVASNRIVMNGADRLVRSQYVRLPLSAATVDRVAENVRESVGGSEIVSDEMYVGLEHIDRKNLWLGRCSVGADATSGKFRFNSGDVLFGKLRPYFHKVAVAPSAGVCSTDILVVRAHESRNAALVAAAASSDAVVATAVRSSNGTKMPRAKWADIASCHVPDPSLAETQAFCATFNATAGMALHANEENQRLAATRDELLPLLMSGKITVKDAEKTVEGVL